MNIFVSAVARQIKEISYLELFYNSYFIIDMSTACFKSHCGSEKLLKFRAKIMVGCADTKGARVCEIPNSTCCSCNTNFKLMVNKCTEECHGNMCHEKNVQPSRKEKELLLKGTNLTQKASFGSKQSSV
jgi:hypothetical protein